MTRSLLARLTLLQQLTAAVAIAAFAMLALGITAQVMRAERRAFVTRTAHRLADGFAAELEEEPDTTLAVQSVIEDGRDVGVQVEVRNASGHVLASTLPAPGARAADATTHAAPRGTRFEALAASPTGIRVRVVATDAAREAALSALGRSLLLAAIPILVASLLLGRVVVARALRPLSTMAGRAADLSLEQNPRSLDARSGLAEVDRLGAAFDRLLERLDDALRAERRLTADASHELRTPLTVLGGELELLQEHTPPGTQTALGLARAADQVAAMRELVDAILILHRSREVGARAAAGFEVVNLCDLVRETLAEVGVRHPGREADLERSLPDEVLVEGNAALLGAAVRNLLDNALKFTRPGERVAIDVLSRVGEAQLAVDDQGAGVSEADRGPIFDPFYRGAGARAGTAGAGLGLPISRRVARAHGGEVDVESSPLGGARFVLRLPLHGVPRQG